MSLQVIVIVVGSIMVAAGIAVLVRSVREKRDDTLMAARIGPIELHGGEGTVLTLLGGLVMLAGIMWLPDAENPKESPFTSTAIAPPTPSSSGVSITAPPPSATQVVIESPTAGQKVVGKSGVLLEGTAGGSDDRKLWLFDHANDDQYYLISSAPLTVTGGRWMVQDPQVGSTTSADDGHTFVLLLARADGRCAAKLAAATPNASGDIVFPRLPDGCDNVAWVNVVKASPR
ncbi:hypothetical protein [Amycolatopsis sp. H20-H5]|uniref:hypothetical protein n=1 Tax=Amycolatopsis sp. H20-H5 TaxID=3046309 RepID=UPI002DBEF363|nr:hypothetical protein [Amycolatopsis sp. H20-H5]MEC3979041.1 hypothetical protein [Amycolatopsis sp. H20-H5]